jgi:hypothetical protein
MAAIVAGAIPALTVKTPFQISDDSARDLKNGTFSIAYLMSLPSPHDRGTYRIEICEKSDDHQW